MCVDVTYVLWVSMYHMYCVCRCVIYIVGVYVSHVLWLSMCHMYCGCRCHVNRLIIYATDKTLKYKCRVWQFAKRDEETER